MKDLHLDDFGMYPRPIDQYIKDCNKYFMSKK